VRICAPSSASTTPASAAVERNERQGDPAGSARATRRLLSLHIDNFAARCAKTGNIINDLIPHVYDTGAPSASWRGRQDRRDGDQQGAGHRSQFGRDAVSSHDITAGSYDVVATMGPS